MQKLVASMTGRKIEIPQYAMLVSTTAVPDCSDSPISASPILIPPEKSFPYCGERFLVCWSSDWSHRGSPSPKQLTTKYTIDETPDGKEETDVAVRCG